MTVWVRTLTRTCYSDLSHVSDVSDLPVDVGTYDDGASYVDGSSYADGTPYVAGGSDADSVSYSDGASDSARTSYLDGATKGYSSMDSFSSLPLEHADLLDGSELEKKFEELKLRTQSIGMEKGRKKDRSHSVFLNIYHVDEYAYWINGIFANHYSPLKFGGIFHVAVQIGNEEWAYGYTKRGTGVYKTKPRSGPLFRESVALTPTKLSEQQIAQLYGSLAREWPGCQYHLLQRNCCHFAAEVALLLGAGDLPEWAYRWSDLGCAAGEEMGYLEPAAMTAGI